MRSHTLLPSFYALGNVVDEWKSVGLPFEDKQPR
jgi:hypothetical protein